MGIRFHSALTNEADAKEEDQIRQLPTPKTPRHRDALSKKIPITPQHRIGLVRKLLTPRSSHTPSTLGAQSVYERARQLFTRSADPGQIVGRTEERSKLHNLILRGIESGTGNCVYISGPPGTGKSALVNDVCRQLGTGDGLCSVFVNCLSFKSAGEVYEKLLEELLGDDQMLEHDGLEELRAMFLPKKTKDSRMYVVVLDEIDHLLSTDLEALYTLFEWSLQRSSKLIVVGIANALDLTDRFLPRLRAKNLKPEILPFSPYTAGEIAEVMTVRLQTLLPPGNDTSEEAKFVPFVHPAAIQLCSKKVALQTGDLRKAFDIIRRSIDVIKHETMEKLDRERNSACLETSPSKTHAPEHPPHSYPQTPLADLTVQNAPRATIAHVSRISAAAFGNGTAKRLTTLNLQQKAALCALIAHQKASSSSGKRPATTVFDTPSKTANNNKDPPPTIRKLHATYSGLCRKDNTLHPLTATEFIDVVGGLETLGLVSDEKKGGGGILWWGERGEDGAEG